MKAHVFKFGFPDDYIDGFLAIESSGPLSVSAVYTAAPLIDKECCKAVAGPVASIDVEDIAATETASSRREIRPGAGCAAAGQRSTGRSRNELLRPGRRRRSATRCRADHQCGIGARAGERGGSRLRSCRGGDGTCRAAHPGADQLVTVDIPTPCFAGSDRRACEFDVIADNRKEIDESLRPTIRATGGACAAGRDEKPC